jgi:hypothetical protein
VALLGNQAPDGEDKRHPTVWGILNLLETPFSAERGFDVWLMGACRTKAIVARESWFEADFLVV